ncbi:MAG: hypothetical protein SFU56_21105 [Capsulimonadales bacterium]|nr:hypothetical protein [Capsulimonadales bacterium]
MHTGFTRREVVRGGVALAVAASLPAAVAEDASASQENLPPDSEYVRVTDGHLTVGGKRIRLWCIIGGFPNYYTFEEADTAAVREEKKRHGYADADALVARFADLGFNGSRLWDHVEGTYVRGDGSREDVHDYFVAALKKKGFRIWFPSISTTDFSPNDVDTQPAQASRAVAWKAAMREAQEKNIGHIRIACVWDPVMEEMQRRRIASRLNHRNLYTGLRVADDPVYAVFELTNEEWWMSKMVGGLWQTLPKYFQETLSAQWHEFLREKYGTEEKLLARWGGLVPGESLTRGTVRIAPLAGGTKIDDFTVEPQARKQLELVKAVGKQEFNRDDFNRHRGEDVLEFFLAIQLAHKRRLGEFVKAQGKAARLAPLLFDTGIGYEIQSQFLHQNADAVSHDAYINGWTTYRKHHRYPWFSGLEDWPRIAEDVPWLEHNRTEGKPYLCYETQIQQPAKYRAEFAFRLLALASIQDWDAVCWHYWGGVRDITTDPRPFDRAMDVANYSHPQGYHFTYDEVQNAMMRAAAHAFRSFAFPAAPTPTTYIWGRRSLYDPASMDYAGSYGKTGLNMLPTTYQYGVRIRIDPTREDDQVLGPQVNYLDSARWTVIQPNEAITFDVRRGGLTMDSPSGAVFTGFMARFGASLAFRNGVVLKDVAIRVPDTMPYREGIAEEKYIGFALVPEDGLPLARSRRLTLGLVSTSFNSGFKMGDWDPAKGVPPRYGLPPGCEFGATPVLVARVRGTVQAPFLRGMRYVFRDWHGREIGGGTVGTEGALTVPHEKPVWIVELRRV